MYSSRGAGRSRSGLARLDDVTVEMLSSRWWSWPGEFFQSETQKAIDIAYGDM